MKITFEKQSKTTIAKRKKRKRSKGNSVHKLTMIQRKVLIERYCRKHRVQTMPFVRVDEEGQVIASSRPFAGKLDEMHSLKKYSRFGGVARPR